MSTTLDFLPRGMISHTPSDTVDVNAQYNHGVYIEGAGNVAVEFEDGTTHTFENMGARDSITCRIKKVKSTGTTVDPAKVFVYRIWG